MKTPEWHSRVYSHQTLPLTIASPKFKRQAYVECRFLLQKLKMKKGEKLLDLPCGTGRHAKFFSLFGLDVTGVDINPTCLKWAKQYTSGQNITFLKGDMSDLSRFYGKFDILTNLFTSFGYFHSEEDNEAVLKEFVRTLKPGGRLVINTINKDWLLKVFSPVSTLKLGKETIIEAREYRPDTSTVHAHWFHLSKDNKTAKVYYNQVRIYNKSEIVSLMKRCGLSKIRVYGSFLGDKFSRHQSTHPIYIGYKT